MWRLKTGDVQGNQQLWGWVGCSVRWRCEGRFRVLETFPSCGSAPRSISSPVLLWGQGRIHMEKMGRKAQCKICSIANTCDDFSPLNSSAVVIQFLN